MFFQHLKKFVYNEGTKDTVLLQHDLNELIELRGKGFPPIVGQDYSKRFWDMIHALSAVDVTIEFRNGVLVGSVDEESIGYSRRIELVPKRYVDLKLESGKLTAISYKGNINFTHNLEARIFGCTIYPHPSGISEVILRYPKETSIKRGVNCVE